MWHPGDLAELDTDDLDVIVASANAYEKQLAKAAKEAEANR